MTFGLMITTKRRITVLTDLI